MNIEMEKWDNGGGVTLRLNYCYDPESKLRKIIMLDFGDVDTLLTLLNEYKAHPSPYCGPTCKVHGAESREQDQLRTNFLASVVVTAVEGGVTYWCMTRNYKWSEDDDKLITSASVEVFPDLAKSEEHHGWHTVTVETIEKGIAAIKSGDFTISPTIRTTVTMADLDLDAGNIDSEAADCIVQAGIFGQLIFG